jgi:[histone H3]-lysine9 N-trimethyltransferase SUV39H
VDSSTLPTESMLLRAQTSTFELSVYEIKNEYAQKLRAYKTLALQKYGGDSVPAIRLTNTLDDSRPPLCFTYIVENEWGASVERPDEGAMLGCEDCAPDMGQGIGCEYTAKCHCLEYAHVNTHNLKTEAQWAQYRNRDEEGTAGLPKLFPYRKAAGSWHKKVHPPAFLVDRELTASKVLVSSYLNSRHPIYECNPRCACGAGCKTREVQRGRRVRLDIFKTKSRGWGLRTLEPLDAGQFVDSYVGEVVGADEANRRTARPRGGRYLFRLDKFAGSESVADDEILEVDGEMFGGPTRFMNHSCEPNCRIFAVLFDKHDILRHNLAFFAIRRIEAGEELTFDYIDRDEEVREEEDEAPDENAEVCHCGAANCRGWVWL